MLPAGQGQIPEIEDHLDVTNHRHTVEVGQGTGIHGAHLFVEERGHPVI